MREIKFRGKLALRYPFNTDMPEEIISGSWVTSSENYGYDWQTPNGCMHSFWEFVDKGFIDPSTVSQWIGMKDSNNVDIYEGDICLNGDWESDAKAYNYRQETVVFINGEGCFSGWNYNIDGMTCKVIGNIYEKI